MQNFRAANVLILPISESKIHFWFSNEAHI